MVFNWRFLLLMLLLLISANYGYCQSDTTKLVRINKDGVEMLLVNEPAIISSAKIQLSSGIRIDSTWLYQCDLDSGASYNLYLQHINGLAFVENWDTLKQTFLTERFALPEFDSVHYGWKAIIDNASDSLEKDAMDSSSRPNVDSVIYQKDIVVDKVQWYEVLAWRKPNGFYPGYYRRIKIALIGDYLAELGAVGPLSLVTSPQANQILNSLRIHKASANFNLYAGKSKELLTALASMDTIIFDNAAQVLQAHHFNMVDSSALHNALLVESYWDEKDTLQRDVRTELLTRLIDTDKDKGVSFINQNFNKITKHEYQQINAMVYLARLHSKASKVLLMKLLEAQQPLAMSPFAFGYQDIFDELADSFPKNLIYLIRLPFIAQKNNSWITFYRLLAKGLDENIINYTVLMPAEDTLIADLYSSVTDFKTMKGEPELWFFRYKLQLLVKMLSYTNKNQPMAQILTNTIAPLNDSILPIDLLGAKIRLGASIKRREVRKIINSDKTSIEVYRLLEKQQLLSLFPRRYLKRTKLDVDNANKL